MMNIQHPVRIPRTRSAQAHTALCKAHLALPLLAFALLAVVLALSGNAHATAADDLDSSLNPAATQICKNLDAIAKSAFVSVIALVLFVAGGIMIWLKVRGGMVLAASGLIGFFLVKKLVPIAKSFGIVPEGVDCGA